MLPSSQKALDAAKQGQVEEACALFDESIAQEADPNCLLQAAFCYRAVGRQSDALAALKRLDENGHTNPPALLLRADIFAAIGRHHQATALYQQLLEIDDSRIQYSAALGLYRCGDVAAAGRVAERTAKDPNATLAAQATLLNGRCLAAQEKYSDAAKLFASVASSPTLQKAARYRIARLQLHQGQFSEAEQILREILAADDDAPGARETLLQTLIHSGQTSAALGIIDTTPATDASLPWLRHATDFLTESGNPDPLKYLTSRWAYSPSPEVFRELMGRLLEAGALGDAQALAEDYANTFSQDHHWRWATMRWLLGKGDYEEVLRHRTDPQQDSEECICEAQFALGHYANALETAQWLCRSAPGDQYFIALLVTGLRCLEDARYSALVDPDTLLTSVSLPAIGGAADVSDDFWREVAEAVGHHHSMQVAPPLQSVQSGIQTPGNLLTQTQQPALRQLKSIIDRAANSFFNSEPLDQLSDAHPLKLFRPRTPFMHASWAIRAQTGTFHRSHVHAKGWYSGTCYIEVPDAIDGDHDAGHLVLGEPPFKTMDPLAPLARVRPEVGRLVLFPSYFWHGTRPFTGEGWRQVVAFDYGKENCFV